MIIDRRDLVPRISTSNLAKKRETTDLGWLICFVFFFIVLLVAGLYCFVTGSVNKLNKPYDSDGK